MPRGMTAIYPQLLVSFSSLQIGPFLGHFQTRSKWIKHIIQIVHGNSKMRLIKWPLVFYADSGTFGIVIRAKKWCLEVSGATSVSIWLGQKKREDLGLFDLFFAAAANVIKRWGYLWRMTF